MRAPQTRQFSPKHSAQGGWRVGHASGSVQMEEGRGFLGVPRGVGHLRRSPSGFRTKRGRQALRFACKRKSLGLAQFFFFFFFK